MYNSPIFNAPPTGMYIFQPNFKFKRNFTFAMLFTKENIWLNCKRGLVLQVTNNICILTWIHLCSHYHDILKYM